MRSRTQTKPRPEEPSHTKKRATKRPREQSDKQQKLDPQGQRPAPKEHHLEAADAQAVTKPRARIDLERRREQKPSDKQSRPFVPKIQYRFLRLQKEHGVSAAAREGALQMIERIEKFPLDAARVMNRWQEFTKGAIDDWKNGRGDNQVREDNHAAFAILYEAVRSYGPYDNKEDLRSFMQGLVPRDDPQAAPGRDPVQQQLLLTERMQEALSDPRIELQGQLAMAISMLRKFPTELREAIGMQAADLLESGRLSPNRARDQFRPAMAILREHNTKENVVKAVTLAVVARVPSHQTLLGEIRELDIHMQGDIRTEARRRSEAFEGENGLADVRKAQIEAAVKNTIDPGGLNRFEAHVLAELREDIELVEDSRRVSYDEVAHRVAGALQ